MKRAVLDARMQAWKRDNSQCQRCAYVTYSVQLHHMRIKGMGGDKREHTECSCNLITLCALCHDYIHFVDRAGAEADGFIISRESVLPRLAGLAGVQRFSDPRLGAMRVVSWPTCDGRWVSEAAA